MKPLIFIAIGSSILLSLSCHREKPVEAPEGYIEYQGELLKTNEPMRYDSNGDGKIDEQDKTISVLGTNLNITQAPDGGPFFGGTEQQGSPSDEGVMVGEKLCYHNVEKYCSQNGGLYAFETTINTSHESLSSSSSNTSIDANNNNIPDYIEAIRSSSSINAFATEYSNKYAAETETAIENAANKQIGENFVSSCIKEAITEALKKALYESNEGINISDVELLLKTSVAAAIGKAVNEAELYDKIDPEDLTSIAESTASKIASELSDEIASSVSKTILTQYDTQVASGKIHNVQGICPDGYHIPSDVEWMIFEQALGMSSADLTKSGEAETTRGADANIVKKMINDHGFNFSGYASINGTYAQRGEAGVYWSSTAGTDEKGDYVWVRQIDTSYTGIIRFKMYEKSGLSIRCFKD